MMLVNKFINRNFYKFLDFLEISKNIIGNNFKIITKPTKPVGVFIRGGCTIKQRSLGFKHKISLKME